MSNITTHVLDISLGRPAANVYVTLEALVGGTSWKEAGRAATDNDGRVKTFYGGSALLAGTYRLSFDTHAYFAARQIDALYPQVIIIFEVKNSREHYHVPLLLSPYGYSTYRGS